MKNIIIILLTISTFSFAQNVKDQSNSNVLTNQDLKALEKEIQHNNEKNDLKIEKLENKIDDNYKELKDENRIRQESIEERMGLYVFFILGLLAILGFLGNFFGKRAIKERVEKIIQEKAEEYAIKKLDEEISKKITDDYVSALITNKGKNAIQNLITKLETEGKEILINNEKLYKDKLAELEKMKLDFTVPSSKIDKRNLEEFSKTLRKVKSEDQYTEEDWFYKGQEAIDKKNYSDAIQFYSKSISLSNKNSWVYNNRGAAYNYLKEFHKAMEDLNKAIEIDPKNAYAYNNRGYTYSKLKEYQKAIEEYNKATELDPKLHFAYNGRGLIYYKLKEYAKAIEEYNKALEIEPLNITSIINLIELFMVKGQIEKAEKVFNDSKSFKKEVLDEVSFNFLGAILSKYLKQDSSNYEKKIKELLKVNPKLTYDFEDLEGWLKTANISEEINFYIKEKIDLLKKFT